MVFVMDRRQHARSTDPAGSVSRHRRVDARVKDVMARRDAAAAQRRDGEHAGGQERTVPRIALTAESRNGGVTCARDAP